MGEKIGNIEGVANGKGTCIEPLFIYNSKKGYRELPSLHIAGDFRLYFTPHLRIAVTKANVRRLNQHSMEASFSKNALCLFETV